MVADISRPGQKVRSAAALRPPAGSCRRGMHPMSRPGSASPTNPRCEHPGGGNDFTSTKAGSAELVGSVNIDPTPDVPAFHLIDRARTQVVPRTPITGGLGPDAAPVSPAQQHRMAGCTGVAGPQERGPHNIRRPRARNDAGDDVRTDAGQVDQHHQRGVNGFLVEPVGAGQCVEPGPQAGPHPLLVLLVRHHPYPRRDQRGDLARTRPNHHHPPITRRQHIQ